MNKNLTTVIVAIVFAGVGFFAGMKYQQNQSISTFRAQFNPGQGNVMYGPNGAPRAANGQNGQFRMRNGGQVLGDIISADDKSITVKMADGSSKIVLFNSNTSINKAESATSTDLKTGEKVAAFGTPNSDGSVTANNIQLNPIIRERPTEIPSATPQQ